MNNDKLADSVNETVEIIRKQSKLSNKTQKQLELLERYYKIDKVNRIITIPFHYKDINEIIDTSIETKSHPVIKKEILSTISEIAHSIPVEFKFNIDIKIDNYRNYNVNQISQSIIDTFETFHFDMEKENKISSLKVVCLIIFGVVILAWLFYLCSKHWFGQSGDPNHDTIHEIVYTVGAVVLWEAVYIIFLPETSYKDISYSILYRINNINLFDKNKKIITLNSQLASMQWVDKNRKNNSARRFLLISGTALICLALCNLTDVVESFLIYKDNVILIPNIILVISTSTIGILAGLGAISYYRDKGPFKSLVPFFGLVSFVFNIGSIIYLSIILNANKQLAIKGIIICSFTLLIVFFYFLSIYRLNKVEKKQ